MADTASFLGIAVAALGGLAVGIDRQRSEQAAGKHPRFGGIRTFTLLGGLAGLAGWLTTLHLIGIAVVLTAGAVALIISGYVAASRDDVDATTEAAALVVVGAGVAAGLGSLALASGIIALTVLLLVEKSEIHALVGRIDDEELRAAVRFAVMAAVILPLLPEGPIGPFGGIRPRSLWLLVLFFTGLSFTGYLARRLLGPRLGYPVAGLLGGIISSTNVTFTFARLSRRDATLARPLAVGAIAACTMLFPRVMIATSVLNLTVARALLPYLVMPFVAGVIALALLWRSSADPVPLGETPSNPLQIGPALEMAVVFQIVLMVVDATRHFFGGGGLLISGAVLGLTDVDALTISMAKVPAAGIAPAVAAQAIAIGVVVNCVLKAGLAAAYAAPRFRNLASTTLAAMAAAGALAIGVLR